MKQLEKKNLKLTLNIQLQFIPNSFSYFPLSLLSSDRPAYRLITVFGTESSLMPSLWDYLII